MRGSGRIRSIAAVPPAERIARAVARVVPRRRDVLAVLTFHRVAPTARVVPGLLSATPHNGDDGALACDSYHRGEEDLALLTGLGGEVFSTAVKYVPKVANDHYRNSRPSAPRAAPSRNCPRRRGRLPVPRSEQAAASGWPRRRSS